MYYCVFEERKRVFIFHVRESLKGRREESDIKSWMRELKKTVRNYEANSILSKNIVIGPTLTRLNNCKSLIMMGKFCDGNQIV